MKSCRYCGRENEDTTARCAGCATEMHAVPPPSDIVPRLKRYLRDPVHVVWTIAALVILQGLVRWGAVSLEPIVGDANPERVDAMVYLFVSAGIASVLIGVGMYLRGKRKDRHAA